MKYKIKFEHVDETAYTAVVEADSYEEAMDIFEKSPFEYVENLEGDDSEGAGWHVSEVTEGDKEVVYKDDRKLDARYI